MIQFYKPNSKNTGAACSFWYSPQTEAFFASIIKQASWNAKTRTGSFQKNKDNPQKNIKIKLNLNEIGGVVDCLENNREFSAYHSSPQAEHIAKIKFAPYIKGEETVDLGDISVASAKTTLTGKLTKTKEKQLGFVFFVSKEPKDDPSQKVNYSIAFNFGESVALRQCLLFMVDSLLTDKVNKIKQKQTNQVLLKPVKKEAETSAEDDEIVF